MEGERDAGHLKGEGGKIGLGGARERGGWGGVIVETRHAGNTHLILTLDRDPFQKYTDGRSYVSRNTSGLHSLDAPPNIVFKGFLGGGPLGGADPQRRQHCEGSQCSIS